MGDCSSKNKVSDVIEPTKVNKKLKTEFFSSLVWPDLPDYLNNKNNLNAHARGKKRDKFDNLDQLSVYLDSCGTENDVERIWLIYVWIADNIQYDFEAYKRDIDVRCDAQGVFENGKTVCSGYANLFQTLCQNINIECKSLNGYSKGYGYEPGKKFNDTNHAWNVVKIGEQWYFVEPTWASGFIKNEKFEKQFNPYWFFTVPKVFLETHFSPDFDKNCSLEEFEKAHQNQLNFFTLGFRKLPIPTLIETGHSPFTLELKCEKDCELIGRIIGPDKSSDVLVQKDTSCFPHKHCIIGELMQKNVKYELELFAREANSNSSSYKSITTYHIIRTKDEINRKIPKYNLDFGHGIRLLSHGSTYLYFDHNPFKLELSGADSCNLIINLTRENGDEIKGACLVQKSLDMKKFLVIASCPTQGKFNLAIFSNKANENVYKSLTNLVLIKEKPVPASDTFRYIKLDTQEAFVEKPLGYYLTNGEKYEFRIRHHNASKMALVDKDKNWIYFENEGKDLFVLKWLVSTLGQVTIFAQVGQESFFNSICSYECK